MCLCNDEAAARAGRRAVAQGDYIRNNRDRLCNPDVPAGRADAIRFQLKRLHTLDPTALAFAERLVDETAGLDEREKILLGLRRLLSVPVNGEITTALSHRLPDKPRLLSQVAAAIEFHAFRTVRPSTVVQPPRWVTPV